MVLEPVASGTFVGLFIGLSVGRLEGALDADGATVSLAVGRNKLSKITPARVVSTLVGDNWVIVTLVVSVVCGTVVYCGCVVAP